MNSIKSIYRALLLILPCATLLTGCNEEERVDTPQFNVTIDGNAFKVGEAVEFSMSGDPDFISFFSGESGYAYEYKDKDRTTPAEMTMSFTTTTSSGTTGYPNPAMTPLSYSVDFDEDYTQQGLERATWIDISSNFKFPTDVPQTSVPSGTMRIGSLFPDDDKPIYFRFHYKVKQFDQAQADGAGNGRTQVNIQNFVVEGVSPAGKSTIYDIMSAKWQSVLNTDAFSDILVPPVNASYLPDMPGTSRRILLRSDFRPIQDRECWAVSGPIHAAAEINTGVDKAIPVKSVADPNKSSWRYTYNTPGEYTLTFVAANSSVYGRKEVIKEFKITVMGDDGTITPPTPDPWSN